MGYPPPDENQAPKPQRSKVLALIIVFSSLIAVSTFLSFKLPPPLGEITWAPPIYMALSILAGAYPSFAAIALGSAIGEGMNVVLGTPGFLPIWVPGMVWARAPEAFIIAWARKRGRRMIVLSMVIATVFETMAFFLSDWAFYTYGLFQYGSPTNAASGFWAAFPDFGTLVDLAYIPVALILIRAAGPAFRRFGFD